MKRPKLIACDIDNTLLMAGQVELSPDTAALIQRVMDEGIVFVPASGRQYVGLKKLFAQFKGELSYVAENGALAYVGDELVHRVALERDLAERIVRTMLERPECEMYAAGSETCYIKPKDPAYADHLQNTLHFEATFIDDIDEIEEPILKASAYHAALNPDFDFWMREYGDRCNVVMAGPDWVDLSAKGSGKGVGVAAICKRLGIDLADCVAFGDSDNDVSMFDVVGCPIAMQHGSEQARAHASMTTPTVNEVLERILEG